MGYIEAIRVPRGRVTSIADVNVHCQSAVVQLQDTEVRGALSAAGRATGNEGYGPEPAQKENCVRFL